MGMTPALEEKIRSFEWPEKAPTSVADAWAFLEANPLPEERFSLRANGATLEALTTADEALGRPLPKVLREALLAHDGIDETWTRSGPFFAGAGDLPAEQRRFRKEWDEFVEAVEEGDAEPEFDLENVDLAKLIAIGHDQTGHVCFVLDTSRESTVHEHPVLCFDAESESFEPRWASLGNFIAWIVCDAHCDPQAAPPEQMRKIFPGPEPDDAD